MNKLPKLCLVIAGGTITMRQDAPTNSLVPGFDLEQLLRRVPELTQMADWQSVFVCDIDSTNMTPALWVKIARVIAERHDQVEGFIVLHGTDTMAYTASALSFLLQGITKPVIVTGAQTPIYSLGGSDAHNNLVFSARFATQDIAEVCIFFGSELLRGNCTRKYSEYDFDAFKSFNLSALGKVGIRPKLFDHRIKRPSAKDQYNEAKGKILAPCDLTKPVFLMKYFPGLAPEVIPQLISLGYRGIVIEGVGPGNLPTHIDFPSQIKRASEQGVPIVVATQCIIGAAEMFLYEVGYQAEKSGAISALDMTPESALTKLSWVLEQTSDLSEIKKLMQTNLVGEISV